jgi:adenylylsulfate kinase-like enzyme
MPASPIFVVTGPPGAGKTTLASALIRRFGFAAHIPVDDLRLWVKSGLSDSVPWTDETERQFQVAEAAACSVARTYADSGFAVVIDHCRNLARLDALVKEHLSKHNSVKVCLLPPLETSLSRNLSRTNKGFDTRVLEDTIRFVDQAYRESNKDGWLVLDNAELSLDASVESVLMVANLRF